MRLIKLLSRWIDDDVQQSLAPPRSDRVFASISPFRPLSKVFASLLGIIVPLVLLLRLIDMHTAIYVGIALSSLFYVVIAVYIYRLVKARDKDHGTRDSR